MPSTDSPKDSSKFEPAFETLIQRCNAEAIMDKLADPKRGVLSRKLFLLAEADLLADDEFKAMPFKLFMTVLKRDLEMFQALQDFGVAFPNPAADKMCETWPTCAGLRNSTWDEVEAALQKADASAMVKRCLSKLYRDNGSGEEEEKLPKFEPAFENLLKGCDASDLQRTLSQRHVNSRLSFVLALPSLRDDELFKSTKHLLVIVEKHLEVFQLFQAEGILSSVAVDVVCVKWPTKAAFGRASEKDVKSALTAANITADIELVLQVHKKAVAEEEISKKKGDVHKKYQAEKEEELKKKREDAKQAIEDRKKRMQEAQKALESIPGADSAAKLKAMEEKFPAKMEELKKLGVLKEGSVDALIQQELSKLDRTLEDLGTVSASLENLAAKVDGGNLLRGVYFSNNGIQPAQALLLAADDDAYTAHNPSAPSETKSMHFKSQKDHDEFKSTAQVAGWSTAVASSGNFRMVSADAASSKVESKGDKKEDVTQTRVSSIIVSRQLFLPTLCLNFDRSSLRLCKSALEQLKQIEHRAHARKFLEVYGSHVLTGVVTVGGRLELLFTAHSEEKATVHQLLSLESSKFAVHASTDVSGVFSSFAGNVSHGKSEAKEKAERTKDVDTKFTTETTLITYGPPVSDLRLFTKLINAHTSYWYVLDRGAPSARLAVWDIARQHRELHSDASCQRSIAMLENTWRADTGPARNPLLWSIMTADDRNQQLNELVQTLLYVCRVGDWLHSWPERVSAFCHNVEDGIKVFGNADFLVDAMTSVLGSTNDVTTFLTTVINSSDAQSKQRLADLLSGRCRGVIQRSFCNRKSFLQDLKSKLPEGKEVLVWDPINKTKAISLSLDDNGFRCVAKYDDSVEPQQWHSVLSSHPLLPSSSSSSSSSRVASFQVKVDRRRGGMVVGVCRSLPPAKCRLVDQFEGIGIGYGGLGNLYGGYNGSASSGYDPYSDGDVIRVEVDLAAQPHTVAFFKNGKLQGEPISIRAQDHNQPLYAALTLIQQDDQATLF